MSSITQTSKENILSNWLHPFFLSLDFLYSLVSNKREQGKGEKKLIVSITFTSFICWKSQNTSHVLKSERFQLPKSFSICILNELQVLQISQLCSWQYGYKRMTNGYIFAQIITTLLLMLVFSTPFWKLSQKFVNFSLTKNFPCLLMEKLHFKVTDFNFHCYFIDFYKNFRTLHLKHDK